jgi:phosphonate transport system substrate-binding protein
MKPVMFENTEDLLNNYAKENIAVITLSPVEYLAYKSKLSLNPVLVSSGENNVLENYIILVRKDDNIDKINNLEDKQIGMLPKESNPSPGMWLDVYLNENKITPKEKFFSKILIGKTESQLIMSVFFGQLNACLVSKSSFETMIELNPQIKNQIKVLKTSPGFLTSVASFTTKFKKSKDSESLLSHLLTLDKYPAGKQLFALTKTTKIVLFKDEYLDNIKILISEYNKLPRQKYK